MPRLRVLAGSSIEDLKPIEANSDTPLKISSDVFEGQIAVYIKGFADADGKVGTSPYFEQAERASVTWSFQVQGEQITAILLPSGVCVDVLMLTFLPMLCVFLIIYCREVLEGRFCG